MSHHPKSVDEEKNTRSMLQMRSAELFKLCDIENKGFINKKDIQRMRDPLGLPPEILEQVFNSLDFDQNGYLTLEEFTVGFSSYLGYQMTSEDHFQENKVTRAQEEDPEDEEYQFKSMIEYLGADEVVNKYL